MSNKIKKVTLEELVSYEKAARIVCMKYENTIKNYNGTINSNGSDYNKFEKFNKIHNKIIEVIEEKLVELQEDENF